MKAPRQPRHRTYGDFLKSIHPTKGLWPWREEDWEEAKAWMDQGTDLSLAVGFPLKSTLLHRLVKQATGSDSQSMSEKERGLPFLHLARLTRGKAMEPGVDEAWNRLGLSYASVQAFPVFSEILFRAFMHERQPQKQAPTAKAQHSWELMLHHTIMMDRPDFVDAILALGPTDLAPLQQIYMGGPRMFAWLQHNFGDLLASNAPTDTALGLHGIGIRSHLNQNSFSFGMGPLYQAWEQAHGRQSALEASLPSSAAARPARPSRF